MTQERSTWRDFGQKSFHCALDVGLFVGGDGHFDAVAGGKNHAFEQSGALLQAVERVGQSLFFKREALAHFDRCGAVIQACEQ